MTPSSKKAKGRTLQKHVRDKILEEYKTLEEDDAKSTAMGQNGVDVQLSPAAKKLFPFSIECKNMAAMTVYRWYEQAQKNTKDGTQPLLVIKENRKKPLVVVDLDYFISNYGVKKETI